MLFKKLNASNLYRHSQIILAFGIWHLAFGIWHLAFGIWHLAFGIWHLAFRANQQTSNDKNKDTHIGMKAYDVIKQICNSQE